MFGWCLILIGIPLFPLPLPLGLPMILIGAAIVLHENHYWHRVLRFWRRRYPSIDEKIHGARDRVPGFARRIIEQTDPRPLRRDASPAE
jgi:hypothetical protein